MNKVLLASEAREIARVEELNKMEEKIRTAISEGKFNISIYGSIQPETVEALREAGYEVKIVKYGHEPTCTISWR